jgi:hypothetical protein
MNLSEERSSKWQWEVEVMNTTSIDMVEVEGKDMMEEHSSKWRLGWRVRLWWRSACRSGGRRWRVRIWQRSAR